MRRVPEGDLMEAPEAENTTSQFRELMRQPTKRRRTVKAGMNRTWLMVMWVPLPKASLMELILMAEINNPLTLFTRQLVMGRKVMKSPHSGEIWVVQPLSRRNSEEKRKTSWEWDEETIGNMEMLEMSMVDDWLDQLMDACILFQVVGCHGFSNKIIK